MAICAVRRVYQPRLNFSFSNLTIFAAELHTPFTCMQLPSPPRGARLAPRTSFPEKTHAVVRCQNGSSVLGKLTIISLTGGLLNLERPLDRGSQVKLMFLTNKGSVFAKAEMLPAISWIQQAFKFTKIYDDDQKRLKAAIQVCLDQGRRDPGQMERSRAW
jgi:hypothetical protein